MRIEHLQSPYVKPAEAGQPVEKPVEGALQAAAGMRSDQTDLSRLSQVLTGDVDKEPRLAELRLEVTAGSYQVPAAEVSRRIVDFHLRAEE